MAHFHELKQADQINYQYQGVIFFKTVLFCLQHSLQFVRSKWRAKCAFSLNIVSSFLTVQYQIALLQISKQSFNILFLLLKMEVYKASTVYKNNSGVEDLQWFMLAIQWQHCSGCSLLKIVWISTHCYIFQLLTLNKSVYFFY